MLSQKIKIEPIDPGPYMNPVVRLERLPEDFVNDIMGRTQKVEIKSEEESESEAPIQGTHRRNKRARKNADYIKNDESDDSIENRCPNKRSASNKPYKKKLKTEDDDSDYEFERMLRQPDSSDEELDDFEVWTKRNGRNKGLIDTIKTMPTS